MRLFFSPQACRGLEFIRAFSLHPTQNSRSFHSLHLSSLTFFIHVNYFRLYHHQTLHSLGTSLHHTNHNAFLRVHDRASAGSGRRGSRLQGKEANYCGLCYHHRSHFYFSRSRFYFSRSHFDCCCRQLYGRWCFVCLVGNFFPFFVDFFCFLYRGRLHLHFGPSQAHHHLHAPFGPHNPHNRCILQRQAHIRQACAHFCAVPRLPSRRCRQAPRFEHCQP